MHDADDVLAWLPAVSVPAAHRVHELLPAALYEFAAHAERAGGASSEHVSTPLGPLQSFRPLRKRTSAGAAGGAVVSSRAVCAAQVPTFASC